MQNRTDVVSPRKRTDVEVPPYLFTLVPVSSSRPSRPRPGPSWRPGQDGGDVVTEERTEEEAETAPTQGRGDLQGSSRAEFP